MKKYFASALLLAVSTFGFGQAISTNGGSIQGTITDASGAAIPGASVTISDKETGYTHTLKTDSAGYYSLGPLIPGSYTIDVTSGAFEHLKVDTVVRTGTVTPGSEKLTVGKQSETVEVNAGSLQINTDQIGVAGIVTREQIDTLPINGRNILDIAQIQPGVILQEGQGFDPTKSGYSAISVSGQSGRTTRILLDGQDITDETVGTTIFNVPEGAVDEFQLNRSTQDVSGEVTSTGQVLVSTRSGTNGFHGNGFYNFQDEREGFARSTGGVAAPFQRNQFGGYVGGPIIKDKLFFFGGIERNKQDEQQAVAPDPNFGEIAGLYPQVPDPFRDTYSTLRLDYSAPFGVHLFVRGTYSVNSSIGDTDGSPYSLYKTRNNIPAIVGGADFTTGKFTHSIRGSYDKFHNILGDSTTSLGSSIYNPSAIVGFPLTIGGAFGGFDAGPNFLAPQQTFQSEKQIRYDGTWTKGAHTVKFGAEVNRIQQGGFAAFFGAAVNIGIDPVSSFALATCASGTPLGGFDGTGTQCLEDPLNGYSPFGVILGNGLGSFTERPGFGLPGGALSSYRIAAYVADTWKAAPWLSVTAGLRWSTDTDRGNQDVATPLCSQVDPSLQFAGCSTADGTGNTPLFNQYQAGLGYRTHQPYGNFGPQAGFVVSPGDHKTSFRGGAGIFFESNIFNNTSNARSATVTAQGKYFNDGASIYFQNDIFLPGYGDVTTINGQSISSIFQESVGQAAAAFNSLKSTYDSASAAATGPNPSFVGTGGELKADNLYAGPFLSPYSIQLNGGVQRELSKGLIISADFVHNATLKEPNTIDVNHLGAARTLNITNAQAAIAATLAECGATSVGAAIAPGGCPGGSGTNGNAIIDDFANNGLDSQNDYGSGLPANINAPAGIPAAFPGINPNVGNGLFILPIGKSGYDALQVVVQQQKSHPLPGIVSSNLQISYSLSRVVSTAGEGNGEGSSDPFFAGARPYDYDNPTANMGRNNNDHSNELSLGGSLQVKYGAQIGFVGHFYSALPATLILPTSTGSGQIFKSDVNGDGQENDVLPGTLPGSYEHQVKGAGLERVISNYNTTQAGTPTPAGQALITAGLFTQAQLVTIGAVQQTLADAPTKPLSNDVFRTFDLSVSYPITYFKRYHQGLSLVPGVVMYNVTNMSNFGGFGGGLLSGADAGTPGFLNGPTINPQSGVPVLASNRIGRGTGTFDQGGPRTTEFQLKLNF